MFTRNSYINFLKKVVRIEKLKEVEELPGNLGY